MRWLTVLFALPFLGACDDDKLPPQPGPPAKPEVHAPAPKPIATREPDQPIAPVESEGGIPPIEIEIEPVTLGAPEELPSERRPSTPPAKPVDSAEPKGTNTVAVEEIDLPEPELDLSLPEDWAEELEPDQETAAMQLLPPLFDSNERSRLEMSGRLLPGDEQNEALIDGAQINFELRR